MIIDKPSYLPPARMPKAARELSYNPLTPLQRFFLWLYIFGFSFDFKGAAGGSTIQYVFAGVAILAFVCFLLVSKNRPSPPSLRFISSYWWAYIAITLITVVAGTIASLVTVSLLMYLRVTLPYLMCGFSLIICQRLASRNSDPLVLVTPMILCGLVSSAWRAYYAQHGANATDIDDLRFQLLSPATPLLIAYGLIGVLMSKKISFLAVVALCASATSVLLSITRGYIITGALCIVILFAYSALQSIRSGTVLLRGFVRLALVGVLGVMLIGVVVVIRPNTLDNWNMRMFSNNNGHVTQDETYLVRLSEVSYDWKAITSSPVYLLVGEGIGASYGHDESVLTHYKGSQQLDQDEAAPADCMWAYAMFSSGIIFGSMMLGIFVLPIYRVTRSIWLSAATFDDSRYDLKLFTLLTLFAYFSTIFTSAPFAERLFGVLMGLFVGLAYWPYETAKRRRTPRVNIE